MANNFFVLFLTATAGAAASVNATGADLYEVTVPHNFETRFNGFTSAEFVSLGDEGSETLKGYLIDERGNRIEIPAFCEPEGGSARLSDAYLIEGRKNYFVFTCKWSVQHSGIGLSGVQYRTIVYTEGTLEAETDVSSLFEVLSGYEGTLEGGQHSFAWYSSRKVASRKVIELESGKAADSISLAHDIVLARMDDMDFAAVKAYLTDQRLKQLISSSPISRSTLLEYNDLGFALAQSGQNERAYALLHRVEKIAPDRVVLKLNLADALWPTDKRKASVYYQKYVEMMHRAGKKALIPAHAIERSAVK